MIDADVVYNVFKGRFRAFLDDAIASWGSMEQNLPKGTPATGEYTHRRLMEHYRDVQSQTHIVAPPTDKSRQFWLVLAGAVLITQGWTARSQLDEIADLLARKRVDYGCKNITDFGEIGIIVRAMDKVYRIENLTARGGDSAVGEPITDAMRDIVGYSGVAFLMVTKQWMDDTVESPA